MGTSRTQLHAHIQRIDSYIVHFTAVGSIKKKNDLNVIQPNLHATTKNFLFFSDFKPLKSTFILKNFSKRGGTPPFNLLQTIKKIIVCPPPHRKRASCASV